MLENHQISPPQLFHGIRFLLLGFDPIKKSQVSRKLVDGGGVDAGQYGPNCTHVIVDKLVYDDPLCVAARQDGKILVSSLWVDHSFDVGAPVDTTSVMYVPVRDLNGIPGAKSLVICLTGYQREDREDIMTMVELMGAQVSKPLIATKVTHLICYKFEGEKYLLAKRVKRIKLINHRWLEDSLKAWEILPEADYSKSGYELEMEAEAKDSEDEQEGNNTRHNEAKISPRHSLLSKQEIPNAVSNTSVSNMFSNAQETVSLTTKTTSDRFPNPHEIKIKPQHTQNVTSVASEPSNHYEKAVSSSSAQNNNIFASTSANKSPQNEAKMVVSAGYSTKDPIRTPPTRTTPSAIDMKSNTSSAKRPNTLNFSDAFNMSSSLVQKATPYDGSAFGSVDERTYTSSTKRMLDISCGSLKPQQMSHSNVVETVFQELKKVPPVEISPARKPPSNISGRKSLRSKGENVICDVGISKTSTSEIQDTDAVQRAQKEYKETNLYTKSDNRDVDMAENVFQSPFAANFDLQKSSTPNLDINEQSAGSNSKLVRKKPVSKKLSAPIETSPARNSSADIPGRIPLGFKGKNVISTAEIGDLNAVQRPQKEYKESSLSTKSSNRDVRIAESDMQSPSAVSSDLQKSGTMNSETNEQSGGSNSKPGRKKSISKKFSAPKLSKKNTVNQKGSIFSKNAELGINDENLLYQQFEKVPSVAKSGTEIEKEAISGVQMENMSEKTSLFMDDDTEPPDDKDEASKEKNEDVVDPCADKNNDENDVFVNKHKVPVHESDGNIGNLASEIPPTIKGKKNTALSMKEVINKKSVEKNELTIDKNSEKQEIRKEATPNRAKRARVDVNDLEKSMEVKSAGVCNDLEHNNDEKGDDVDANMDTKNAVNKKETTRNKRPSSKTKKVASKRTGTDLEKSVEVKRAGVCNDPERNNDEKGDDVDADMDIENVANKNETKRNKCSLSKTKKDVSKRLVSDLEKAADVERVEGVRHDPAQTNNEKDDDVDIENVNKKEPMRNKRPLSKTKKDASKRNTTEQKKEEKDNNVADMDTENSLNKKETKKNKRPLSRTKKDDANAVNKKGKPTTNQAVETSDLNEAQKENVQIHVNDQSTGNKHVFKPAKEVTEKNTDKANSNALKNEPMWFILTGHKLQRREFQQIIRRLKGKVCRVTHNWSYQATHFIVPDPIRRTEKFFAAAASGRWILKTDYLSASNQAGKFLPEETYEWHKNGLSEDGQINLEAPRKWRLLKEKTGHGAFHGMKIVIYGECIAPSLDTLKRAVKAGDGTILATSPPYTRFLNTGVDFAVVSPGMPPVDVWVQEFLKHEIPCVTADYLVEYVCKPGYPLERHVQYATNVWADRSYNGLKNRLEEEISEPRTPESTDVACEVCGARERGDEMLICGDEGGSIGCGVGTHIDCCDPPLAEVPEEDWFCSKCRKKPKNSKGKKGSKK
ncbi:putative chromatin regulator PHD family [Helianthus annuus]|uniref:Chromatin regulator PHD family n=1 Tax=Helianthus annuus TaxID=4232 RepID=A0A251S539_HELAN|nr:BRCT domain-containing protein At4g02110 [Helianthus annuus]KAF5811045.1 putative chromatin regulator PHD family [Helianthus annuus]KAJ0589830.1 putative chromatin regulator PHD family [Helianthus annuus]